MPRRTFEAAALTLASLVAVSISARAETYSSPLGFRIDCPPGWEVASREFRRAVKDASQPQVDKIDGDLGHLKVVIINPAQDGFGESINVTISPYGMRVDESTAREFRTMIEGLYAKMGARISSVECRAAKFGRNRAISVRHEGVYPGSEAVLRQWQVYVPGASRTFIVTCTALANQFDEFEPVFEKALHSFEADTGAAGLFLGLPEWARNIIVAGAIGAVMGGVGGLWAVLAKRKAARGEPREG